MTRGLLCDIDDTLTTDGRLTAEAYGAMERLQRAGLAVIPITGRPAGWCDHIARMWPVDGVVGENGAFYFRYDDATRRMAAVFRRHARRPGAGNRERLDDIAQDIVRSVPGAALAADQPYRETDLAIDFCEDVPRPAEAAVDGIVELMSAHGLTAKVSSIHVNGWFGAYDKLAMARRLLADEHGIDLDEDRAALVFIGDSPNDAPMFGHFPALDRVSRTCASSARASRCTPASSRAQRYGEGFREAADAILQAASTPSSRVPRQTSP